MIPFKRWAVVTALLCFVSQVAAQPKPAHPESLRELLATGQSVFPISMTKLLAGAPEFDQEYVIVKGWLTYVGGLSLYFDKHHAEINDNASAAQVEDRSPSGLLAYNCPDRYVAITARLSIKDTRTQLIDVVKIEDIGRREVCWSPADEE